MNDLSLYETIPPLEKNFPVKLVLHAFSDNGFAAHWHEHMEILYLTSGRLRMYCGSELFEVGEGDLVFINSNEIHFSEKDEDSVFWCMHISPGFFRDIRDEGMVIENVIRQDPFIRDTFFTMIEELKTGAEGYDMALKAHAYLFMTHVLRHYKKNKQEIGQLRAAEEKLRKLNRVFQHISLHYAEKLTTSRLAGMVYLNEQYFCKLFKDATGQSVIDYINRLRIEKAAVLLENTTDTMTNVALRVGFDDPNYFSRMFRRYMTVTPREYRKMKE